MSELVERLQRVLGTHGVDLSADQFLAMLAEAAGDSAPLTAGEAKFLTFHSGVPADRLTLERNAAAQQAVAVAAVKADASAVAGAYTTSEVAKLLGVASANVRRALVRGDLYAAGRAPRTREHTFPIWQFHDGRPLPHLADVLAALPGDMHPLDVETVMTTPCEPLRGRSPVEWLASGGDPNPVVRYATDIDRW
jgi:hypothetical protein